MDSTIRLKIHKDGKVEEQSFQEKTSILIGRASGNDITINDTRVSSCHGQIVLRNGRVFYQDLQSTNGSMVDKASGERYVVDGKQVAEIEIEQGDKILIGDANSPVVLEVSLHKSKDRKLREIDRGKTIVAEQAMIDFESLIPEKLSASEKLRLIFKFVKMLDSLDTEQSLYRTLTDALSEMFPDAAAVVCCKMPSVKSPEVSVAAKMVCDPTLPDPEHIITPFAGMIQKEKNSLLIDPSESGIPSGAVIMAPIMADGLVVASIAVISNAESAKFTEEDLDMISVFASLASGRLSQLRTMDTLRANSRRLEIENRFLKHIAQPYVKELEIIGQSKGIRQVKAQIEQVAPIDIPVLILGETGTGKELVARALHTASGRKPEAFAAVNCGAIPEALLESELFGHVKGAFTGAFETKKGLFEAANGGTLFLDEIGDMPAALQVKLLRALEEKEILPVGATRPVPIDVRIVCATNQQIEELVELGKFRKDLYYRINGFTINLPPLRERGEDILLLAYHFAAEFARQMGRAAPEFSPEAKKLLLSYPWPGNVRQLRNEIQRAILVGADAEQIGVEHFSPALAAQSTAVERYEDTMKQTSGKTLKQIMEAFETEVIISTLEKCGWNKSEAARRLGISRQAFMLKLSKLGITKPK